MKWTLIAVGHLKDGPEKTLFDHYYKRLMVPLLVKEIHPKKTAAKGGSKNEEGDLILKVIDPQDYVIILDEKGDHLSTDEFYHVLEDDLSLRVKNCLFIIGGADGLSDPVRKRSQRQLCLGRMTWPHMLVRALLVEQLYRCQQIKSNHPYHRQG
ncbi:MAG: 23S rRNA (pseudouridine(1915)-N(3))-methyltransferase RlmH [Alphaproteobacteria bacterium]|nr:23S rRNA (pseudouridine(1915)-N(3))-methyltransferase RlmH [Alphaproteobacteria bacterium]